MKETHRFQPALEVRDLRLVSAIASEGGVARAAQALHLTQSALSHHLRALEARLGVALFERVGRQVVLNAHGAQVVALADRLLPELAAAEEALRAPAPASPAFRITMGCYTVYPWLPTLLARFAREMPGVRCEVVVEATHRAASAVVDGELDAAITPIVEADARLRVRRAFEEDVVVAMRPDDPLARREHITPAHLTDRAVYSHEAPREQLAWFRSALGKSALSLRHVQRIPLTEAILDLVRAGMGVALLGSWTVARDVGRGELITRPLRPRVRRSFAVVTSRERSRDPRAELLADVLGAVVASPR